MSITSSTSQMKRYYGKTIGSFLVVLLLMPIGHALMILMEHFMTPTVLHCSAFLMGFVGLVITIIGAFQKGDTKQTIWGITGAMFFWTGWVEFLFVYYAERYGVHVELLGTGVVQTATHYQDGIAVAHDFMVNGQSMPDFSNPELRAIRGSRPEYLIMPATFGMWMMFMVLYLFCTRTGCNFLLWIQKHCHIQGNIELHPMAHHSSIVVFMEWNVMMWGLYLLLMFCYDHTFLGPEHPLTYGLAIASLIATVLMLKKMIHIPSWGRSIRFALATVIVFWTAIEIFARNRVFNEIWVDPMNHLTEMYIIAGAFVVSIIVCTILFKHVGYEDCHEAYRTII